MQEFKNQDSSTGDLNNAFIEMIARMLQKEEPRQKVDEVSAQEFTYEVFHAVKDLFEGTFLLRPDSSILCKLITGDGFEIKISRR